MNIDDLKYHGSDTLFKNFKESNNLGSFGAGVNTGNTDLARTYAEQPKNIGYMYELELPNKNLYANWDSSINSQGDYIKQSLNAIENANSNKTYGQLYNELVEQYVKSGVDRVTAQKNVSNEMLMNGIKGNYTTGNFPQITTYAPEDVSIKNVTTIEPIKQGKSNLFKIGKNILKGLGNEMLGIYGDINDMLMLQGAPHINKEEALKYLQKNNPELLERYNPDTNTWRT